MKIDHSRNLLIKAVAVGLLIYLALPIAGTAPSGDRWITAIVTALVGYLLGDLMILPRWGSTWAAVADVFLIAGTIMIMDMLLAGLAVSTSGALMIGVIGGVVEWFFHLFLKQTPPDLKEGNPENRS